MAETLPAPITTMSGLEMAVTAAQARTALARLRDFNAFAPEDETALDRVESLLVSVIEGFPQ